MTDDMIERVAAAMWERTHDGRWDDWGDGQDESRIIHRDDARAAIEAMESSRDAEIERLRARLALADAAIDQALRQAWGRKP